MTKSELENLGDMAFEYFKDRQDKGYSQAEVIREILKDSLEAGEEVTDSGVKSWLQRTIKDTDIKFANGNKKRAKKGNTKVTQENKDNINSNTIVTPSYNELDRGKELKGMEEKLDKILNMLEASAPLTNNANTLAINLEDKEVTHVSIRLNKGAWEVFNDFCETSIYKKQDLLSQALIEFCSKYKQ